MRLTRRAEMLLLLAITALAAFLRLYRLDALPPGDGHDVAQYGVDALQILGGARPVFFESNFGREPLFSYLVALAYRFTGPGAYGIHLASALVGTLTIPAIWLAARALFAAERETALRWLPLLAALLAAISYWHLNWSRVGLRVILVPLFAALITWALWRGFATSRPEVSRPDRLANGSSLKPVRSLTYGWFLLAGALLGLSLYTYQAARLLPILVAVAFGLRAFWQRRWTRRDTAAALLTAAAALVVFLPLGVYAFQHPGALSVRIQQATVVQSGAPLGQQLPDLIRQAWAALLTYSVRGDTDPQFTIPGRPSLNPLLSVAFAAGLLAALWRFRRSPYLYLLAWLAIMTAPALVADQAAAAKRYLGAFPAVMVLISVGLLLPFAWLHRRPKATRVQHEESASSDAGSVGGHLSAFADVGYTGVHRPASEDADSATGKTSASENADFAGGTPASEDADSATGKSSASEDADSTMSDRHSPSDTRHLLVAAVGGLLSAIVLLYTAAATVRDYFVVWAADPDLPVHFQADYRAIGEYIGNLPDEQPVWLSPFPAEHPVIQLHAGLRPDLRGYNGRFCVPYADPVGPDGAAYVIVPGLQDHSLAALQALFPGGETVNGPLRPGSDRPYYRAFLAPAAATPAHGPDVPLTAHWAGGIELIGYTIEGEAAPGQTLAVTLFYRAAVAPAANYTAFVHLLGPPKADGSPLWAQSDSEPCGGGLPTGLWRPGDVIRDTVTLQLPPELPPGEYELLTGFYSWPDLRRLPVDGSDAIALQTVVVR